MREISVHRFSKILSEFALEYRTTRDRVLQQKQKRADHRERNKTRGKMIMDVNAPVSLTHADKTHSVSTFFSSLSKSSCSYTCLSMTLILPFHCSLMMTKRVRYLHVCWLYACVCLCVCLSVCMKPLTLVEVFHFT